MIISYINWVLIYTCIKHKNDDAITTRVLLFGSIGTIAQLMSDIKRQLLHTYQYRNILTCSLTITIVIIIANNNDNNDSDSYSLVFIIMDDNY